MTYASVLGSLSGHELCTTDPWIYKIGPDGGPLRGHPVETGAQHGQRAIADAVASQSGGRLNRLILPGF